MRPPPLLSLAGGWLITACSAFGPHEPKPSHRPRTYAVEAPAPPPALNAAPPDDVPPKAATACPPVPTAAALCDCLDGAPSQVATACRYERYDHGFGHFEDTLGRHWATQEVGTGLVRLGLLGEARGDAFALEAPQVVEIASGLVEGWCMGPPLRALQLRVRRERDPGNWEVFDALCPEISGTPGDTEPRCTLLLRERARQAYAPVTRAPVGPVSIARFSLALDRRGMARLTAEGALGEADARIAGRYAIAREDVWPEPGPAPDACPRSTTAEELCRCLDHVPEPPRFERCSIASPGPDSAVMRSRTGQLHALRITQRGLTWLGEIETPSGVNHSLSAAQVIATRRGPVAVFRVIEQHGSTRQMEREHFCPVHASGRRASCLAIPVAIADQDGVVADALISSRVTTRLRPDGRLLVEPTAALTHAELRALVGTHALPW